MTSGTSTRLGVTLAAVALLVTMLTACGGPGPRSLLRSIDGGTVILGVNVDQPGLGERDADGRMSGFDVDVAQYVIEHIAHARSKPMPRISWRETPPAQRERLIEHGEVDAVAASYSIDAARSQKVSFGGPYLTTRQGLMVRANSRITTLDDLARNRSLCSVAQSTSAQTIKDLLPTVRLTEFDTYAQCADALSTNGVDAITTDETILAGYSRARPGAFRLIDLDVPAACAATNRGAAPSGTPRFESEHYGIGLAHDDSEALDAVNAALRAMIETGRWDSALQRAFGATEVNRMIERAGGRDEFVPRVGDLSFVHAPTATCVG